MNVYDFDKTIYAGNSMVDYCFFVLGRHPFLIKYLPTQIWAALSYLFGRIEKKEMKERLYRFFPDIDTVEEAKIFWAKHKKKIYPFYLEKRKPSDVVISASPEFFLKIITDELGINIIGSPIDPSTGKHLGENCFGDEKVARFRAAYGDAEIDEFYSDSNNDLPLARVAKNAFRVARGKIIPKGFKF